jgi:hypothetical protein
MATLLILMPLFGHAGPGVSSGGDVHRSTPEQVRAAIDSTGQWLGESADHLELFLDPKIGFPKMNPKAREMLTKMLAVMNYIAKDGLVFQKFPQKGPCREGIRETDASIRVDNTKRAKVCFSVDRLTRLPIEELQANVDALFAHEVAHSVGYGEDDANFIQSYYLDFYKHFDCHLTMETVDTALKERNPKYYYTSISIDFDKEIVPSIHIASHITGQEPETDFVLDRYTKLWDKHLDKIKGTWDFESGGHLEFPTVESDGSLKTQRIEFGPSLKREDNPWYLKAPITGGSIIIDGQTFPVSEVYFRGCYR